MAWFSRLGAQALGGTPEAYAWAQNCPIAKQVNGTDVLQQAPAGAIKVFRLVDDDANGALAAGGAAFAYRVLDALGGYRAPNLYVELLNECFQWVGSGLEPYTDWIAQAAPILQQQGLLVAGFSFSTGNPNQRDWQYIQSRGYGGVNVVACHEYWANNGFTLDNALRHRQVYQWTGGSLPGILITECGRDAVDGASVGGYQAQGVDAGTYLNELLNYDAAISADSYVLGATIFASGAPSGRWQPFNIDPLVSYWGVNPADYSGGGGMPTLNLDNIKAWWRGLTPNQKLLYGGGAALAGMVVALDM